MKKMITTLTIGLLSLICLAPTPNLLTVVGDQGIRVRDKILLSHMKAESGFDTHIVNRKENAVGILQIRPTMINEANRICRKLKLQEHFTLADRTDSTKSVRIWYIVQRYHNPSYDITLAARLWNSGTTRYMKATIPYVKQIKTLYYEMSL